MTDHTTIILSILAVLLLIPASLLFAQVFASMGASRPTVFLSDCPKVAVVVPAHNESRTIRHTVESIMAELPPGGRLLVVADNCTDDTALLAAAAGAEVTERRNARRIGKGYALDHGVRFLARTAPPEVVIFIDADCEVAPQTIERIAQLSRATGRPVQAKYVMLSPPSAGALERMSRFAWTVKTFLRPLGSRRLGLPCQLMGTGMAFPWFVIGLVDLATGHLAEDQKFGADLALVGKAPLFCPEAQVTSWFPSGDEGKRTQRTRWEHGHLAMIGEYLPRLLIASVSGKSLPLLLFALDLSIPPLSLLALLMILLECLTLAWLGITGSSSPFLISSVSMTLLASSIGLAWWRFGRDIIPLRDLFAAPVYCASKIPPFSGFSPIVRFIGSDQIGHDSRRQLEPFAS